MPLSQLNRLTAADLAQAIAARKVSPVEAMEAALRRAHEIVRSYFTYPFNLTGQPAGSLPCGIGPDGLPIGLQFVTWLGCEARLIGAMRAAEMLLGTVCPAPIEPRSEL